MHTHDEELTIHTGSVAVGGQLRVPDGAAGIVVFAHGSGSSRHSPRNRYVADRLNRDGLGTLLIDLLTVNEQTNRADVFDIGLLGRRLVDVTAWLRAHAEFSDRPVGYFDASTGAAAALVAATDPETPVVAIVSRGGRPDLAGARLGLVRVPTLLIVGSRDLAVLDLNRTAQQQLSGENKLVIVPDATHLFEEPGALEQVAQLASKWFLAHFASSDAPGVNT